MQAMPANLVFSLCRFIDEDPSNVHNGLLIRETAIFLDSLWYNLHYIIMRNIKFSIAALLVTIYKYNP